MAAWTAHGMCMEYGILALEAHLCIRLTRLVRNSGTQHPLSRRHPLQQPSGARIRAQTPARELPLSTPPPSQGSNAAPRLAQGSKERWAVLHPRLPRRRKRPFGAEAPHPVEMKHLRSGEATRSCCAGRQVACGAYVCVRTRRKCSYMNGATGFDATARPY